jgi:hypothetical protein
MTPIPLILLFGLPRSGTTWAGKILDSHPDTLYRHEPDSWGRLGEIPLLPEVTTTPERAEVIRAFVAQLPHMRATKVAGSLPVFPKSYRSPLMGQLHRAGVLAAKAMARLTGELPVPDLTRYRKAERLVLVWKSIESLGRMGLLARTLPEARGILLVRHPCGFVASVLRGEQSRHFTSDVPASEDYGIFEVLLATSPAVRRGLTLADLRAMRPEERLAWRWVLFNEKAMEDIGGLEGYEVIRYEDLCRDPKGVTARMFDRVGLPMSDQTRAFLAESSQTNRDGYFAVYKDSARSAARWEGELDSEVARRIQEVARGTKPGNLFLEAD